MGKLSNKDIEEIRECCSYGCEYSDTKEIVADIVFYTLDEINATDLRCADEITLNDGKNFTTLDVFLELFWDKAVCQILNVVETQ